MSNFKIFAVLATVVTASTVLVEHLPLETYGKQSKAEVALFANNEVDFATTESDDFWAAIGSRANNGGSSSSQRLGEMLRGNERFVAGTSRSPESKPGETSSPSVVVLSCADCPLPNGAIFDMQAKNLFNIQVAGNLLSPAVVEGIDYATNRMGIKLIVVLGHEQCSIVRDLVDSEDTAKLLATQSVLLRAAPIVDGDTETTEGVEHNVRWAVDHLAELPQLRTQIAEGDLKIVGGILDESTGRVTLCQ